MPAVADPDAMQRRADQFMRGRLAQRDGDTEYGYAVVMEGAPRRSLNDEQCAQSEKETHEA
jgi:hypothetical protein